MNNIYRKNLIIKSLEKKYLELKTSDFNLLTYIVALLVVYKLGWFKQNDKSGR